MNLYKVLHDYVKEILLFRQFRRMNKVCGIITLVLLCPLFIIGFIQIGVMYLLASFIELLFSPTDYLKSFVHTEGKDVRHLTQAVVYLICIPFIFFLEVVKSFMSLTFAVIFFFNSIWFQLTTLQGISFQPFAFKQVERNYEYNYDSIALLESIFCTVLVATVLFSYDYIVLCSIYYYISIMATYNALIIFVILLISFIMYPIFVFNKKLFYGHDHGEKIFDIVGLSVCGVLYFYLFISTIILLSDIY